MPNVEVTRQYTPSAARAFLLVDRGISFATFAAPIVASTLGEGVGGGVI